MMDLEFHQLELRYEHLRRRAPEREKRLLASLALVGQQTPIVVVDGEGPRRVVVDGYKRVRALRQLKADTVRATSWALEEAEALLLERLMRCSGSDDVFEQGWLLRELAGRFGLSHDVLARRFDKSPSWVSRRLSLVTSLPTELQRRVQEGQLVAHAAMKYLVPMARANRGACMRLVESLGKHRPSTRQMGALYGAWLAGDREQRERIIADPWLFLRAQEQARRSDQTERPAAQQLLGELGAVAGICRRTCARLRAGLARSLAAPERDEVSRCVRQTQADTGALFGLLTQELADARPEPAHGHS
jgi:ParB family transcriptional regulator, chromosome partitioning protein